MKIAGLMMGVWFLSISLGSKLAGWAAGFDEDDPGSLFKLFGTLGMVAIIAGLILAALDRYTARNENFVLVM